MKAQVVCAAFLLLTGNMALAQGPNPTRGNGPSQLGRHGGAPGQVDPLAQIRRALEDAGAPALSSEQEASLRQVVENFRDQFEPPDRPSLRAARRAFEDAVLNGDLAGAQRQAEVLANLIADQTATRLRIEADIKIQVLSILSAVQVDALIERIGTKGLFQLLGSVLHRPRPAPEADVDPE